jgi:hypothetical protein
LTSNYCTNATIANNDIGPCGQSGTNSAGQGLWADGISFACTDSVVKSNTVCIIFILSLSRLTWIYNRLLEVRTAVLSSLVLLAQRLLETLSPRPQRISDLAQSIWLMGHTMANSRMSRLPIIKLLAIISLQLVYLSEPVYGQGPVSRLISIPARRQ